MTSDGLVTDVLGIFADVSIAPIVGAVVIIALFGRFARGFKGFMR